MLNQKCTEGFGQLANQFECISNPRTIGSVAAFDIELPGHRPLYQLSQLGFEHHLTIRPLGNTIYLYLPIMTSETEVSDIIKHLNECLDQAIKK